MPWHLPGKPKSFIPGRAESMRIGIKKHGLTAACQQLGNSGEYFLGFGEMFEYVIQNDEVIVVLWQVHFAKVPSRDIRAACYPREFGCFFIPFQPLDVPAHLFEFLHQPAGTAPNIKSKMIPLSFREHFVYHKSVKGALTYETEICQKAPDARSIIADLTAPDSIDDLAPQRAPEIAVRQMVEIDVRNFATDIVRSVFGWITEMKILVDNHRILKHAPARTTDVIAEFAWHAVEAVFSRKIMFCIGRCANGALVERSGAR